MTDARRTRLSEIALWAMPILLAIIGFFCAAAYSGIQDTNKSMQALREDFAAIKAPVAAIPQMAEDVHHLDTRVSVLENARSTSSGGQQSWTTMIPQSRRRP